MMSARLLIGQKKRHVITVSFDRISSRNAGMERLLDGATVGDAALDLCLPRLGAVGLESLHHVHALDDLAEHDVAAVEPRRLDRGDEEL